VDISIRGAERLAKVAGAIARTTPELRKDLLAGLRKVVKPYTSEIRQEAADTLPRRGGFAAGIAGATYGSRTRTHGKGAGVRITGKQAGHDIAGIEAGLIRKPLFGDRGHWYSQAVRPGFFSRPVEEDLDILQKEVLKVTEDFANRLQRRAQ
jgi:hypothetical protein